MSWAMERRTLILVIIGLVILTLLAGVAIATFYNAPTCNDGKQNEDEAGIDCGGASCTYLCSASLYVPTISYVRTLSLPNGRTDVIAYVENKNTNAFVRNAEYTLELFDANHTQVGTQSGVLDLPSAGGAPVYLPNLFTGNAKVVQAFLTFTEGSLNWQSGEPHDPRVSVTDSVLVRTPTPRLTAILMNNTPDPIAGVKVIAGVMDTKGNAIAASQTVVSYIPAFEQATAVFTWNEPFSATTTLEYIYPVNVSL